MRAPLHPIFPASMCATQPAAWCRLSTLGNPAGHRRPGDRAALQQLCLGPHQWRRCAGLQLRPGGGRDGTGSGSGAAARLCLRMDRHHLPGTQGRLDRDHRFRARDRLRLPHPGGAIRELVDALHGPARGAAGAVRRDARAVAARHADRRLFADRLRHADRPCRQERDPDRGVRQAAARGGSRASSKPRWRRRGCGCGRSS